MAYRIVTRSEIGLPDRVTNMNGSPRNQLAKGRDGLTVHYVGAGSFEAREPELAILSIEQYARTPQKATPFEYNFMIHQRDDDRVYEYAGYFQAAHSSRNNAAFFGVCLLNGVAEKPTDRQIDKVRWLRHQLTADGWIRSGGKLLPHQRMPGQEGATTCPGQHVMTRWREFELPWTAGAPAVQGIVSAGRAEPSGPTAPVADGFGHHLVRKNETTASITALHYGSDARSSDVADANGGRDPVPGNRWNVPGVDGAWVTIEAGWGALSCIRAAGGSPSAAAVARFWSWNGGDPEAGERGPLTPGELVWVESGGPQVPRGEVR